MGNIKSKDVVIAQNASSGVEGYVEQRLNILSIVSIVIIVLVTAVVLHYVYRRCHANARRWVEKQMRNTLPCPTQPSGVATQATGSQGVMFTA